jgi:cardiolipin synthase
MRTAFQEDQANSNEVTLQQWRRRSLLVRAKELAARIWEYWL